MFIIVVSCTNRTILELRRIPSIVPFRALLECTNRTILELRLLSLPKFSNLFLLGTNRTIRHGRTGIRIETKYPSRYRQMFQVLIELY